MDDVEEEQERRQKPVAYHVKVVNEPSACQHPREQSKLSIQLPVKPQSVAAMTVEGQNPKRPSMASTRISKPNSAVRVSAPSPLEYVVSRRVRKPWFCRQWIARVALVWGCLICLQSPSLVVCPMLPTSSRATTKLITRETAETRRDRNDS